MEDIEIERFIPQNTEVVICGINAVFEFQRYDDERLRVAINLQDAYAAWVEVERDVRAHSGRMVWKQISGRSYLYHVYGNVGHGRSLGPHSEETQARYERFQEGKERARARLTDTAGALETHARLYRALRLPLINSQAAAILREADVQAVLGRDVMVVGTTVLAAYQLEATARFVGAPESTADFDLAWTAEHTPDEPVLWPVLKAVDDTFTVNTERPFQARNSKSDEVELLVGPARIATLRREPMRPVNLREQDWLLNGRTVDHVVCGLDGRPARIVAPDPRWFALQKAWLSLQDKRSPLKRPKDARQAAIVWQAIRELMPQYPIDAQFAAAVSDELHDAHHRVLDEHAMVADVPDDDAKPHGNDPGMH